MPFCPKCKCEYRPGFNECADCGVWLVDSLEEAERKQEQIELRAPSHTTREPEYSDDVKRIMKSLPAGPSIPKGAISPGRSTRPASSQDEPVPDPNDEFAKNLDEYPTWIEIAHFPSAGISRMIGDALRSNDIPFVIFPGVRGGEFWGGSGGGLYETEGDDILLVPEQFVERADEAGLGVLGEIYETYKTPNS